MKQISVVIQRPMRPVGGAYSHFAHFIGDFVLPFHSLLHKNRLIDILASEGLELELRDIYPMRFGPLMPIVNELFPNLHVRYTSHFTCEPIRLQRPTWYSSPQVVEDFLKYVTTLLPLKTKSHGVIIVEREFSRDKYPGGRRHLRSGADRRGIRRGFKELVEAVKAIRPDTRAVVLERLSFADQLSLFLTADTMIAQHGAALVHSQWMPIGSHIIELQHLRRSKFPDFVWELAQIRNHKVSVAYFPGPVKNGRIILNINDPSKVIRYLQSHSGGTTPVCSRRADANIS
jgi:hypothetical protein